MTDWLSVSEAARRYQVSDKSIRNWIKAKMLTPHKVRVNGKLQYAIDPAKLEEVMRERNMTAIPIHSVPKPDTAAQEHIAHLEQRLDNVERRIAKLEQERYAAVEYRIPEPTPPVEEGTMEVHEFTVLHNLHIGQVRNVVGSVSHINKAGMHAVWQEHHTKTRFRKCVDCPHE